MADLVTAAPPGEEAARVPWPVLEARIQAWILALRRLVRAALAEHRIAAAVWPAPHDEAAFSEVVARPLAAAVQVTSHLLYRPSCACLAFRAGAGQELAWQELECCSAAGLAGVLVHRPAGVFRPADHAG